MKIFLSWSGDRSKAVANAFADWLKCVLQAADPWISTQDIERGAVWFNEIGDTLNEATTGIVFLTQQNKNRPWVLFEAGALYKGLNTRVCTFLIDLQPADIEGPLGEFNHTFAKADSIRALVHTLNARLAQPLEGRVVEQVFATYWPQFEAKLQEVLRDVPDQEPAQGARTEQNMLAEILDNTRSLSKRVAILESNITAPRPLFGADPLPSVGIQNPNQNRYISGLLDTGKTTLSTERSS